jgi:hypothetical protein
MFGQKDHRCPAHAIIKPGEGQGSGVFFLSAFKIPESKLTKI